MNDPFAYVSYEPADVGQTCPHGNGNNCECMLTKYRGLFVARIEGDKEHHRVVRLQQAYDGGMYQFFDPINGNIVGSCGCNRVLEFVTPIHKFVVDNAVDLW